MTAQARHASPSNPPIRSRWKAWRIKRVLSQVELIGLANANFKEMTFGGGAGSYTLDFTGTLMQDAKVTVTSGVSSMKIIIPNGTRSQVTLTGGLNNVDQSGTWTVKDKVYQTDGTGPLVSITVEMGVGNLELIHQ